MSPHLDFGASLGGGVVSHVSRIGRHGAPSFVNPLSEDLPAAAAIG
jgi:hypothetical protein